MRSETDRALSPLTDQSVQEAGARSDQARGERHHAVDLPPARGLVLRLLLHAVPLRPRVRPRPPAAHLLLRAVPAALCHAPQRRGRLLWLRQRRAAAAHLRGAQQVRHPERPQTGLHRGHAVPAGLGARAGQPRDEHQQRAVRPAKDGGGGHQDGRPELPQHGRHPGDGGPGDGSVAPGAAVQGAAAADGRPVTAAPS